MKKFTVYAKEINKKDGGTFLTYITKINNEWYRVKFTRDCDRVPHKRGAYTLQIATEDLSIQDGPVKNGFKENDIIWVKHITDITKASDAELKARSAEKVNKIFGVDVDDLPF